MRKMKTLFERTFSENGKMNGITPNVTPGCEWVLQGEGTATRKLDGTCCLIVDRKIYARYDAKAGKAPPQGAIPCQKEPDPITGHFPHWVFVENQPQYRYHREALERQNPLADGTYELCGVHFQCNVDRLVEAGDALFKHGDIVLDDVPRTFEGIRDYLSEHEIEGIVFHRENGDMCKIKRSDFGFAWIPKRP